MKKEIISYFVSCILFLSLNALHASLDNIDVHAADNNVEAFGKKIAKKFDLKYLNNGVGTIVDSKKVAWDISLMTNRQWTIDQARPVVTAIMAEFWNFTSQDKDISLHMHALGGEYKWYDPILTPNRLGLKIAFWDQNVNRPKFPYVSQVIVSEGTISYYFADPKDQSLQPPVTEPLQLRFQ